MHPTQWQLQDAKARFSEEVEAAMRGEPQHITRRGKEAVVVLSEREYEILQHSTHAAAPGFIAHLLAVPKNDETFERLPLTPRNVDFT